MKQIKIGEPLLFSITFLVVAIFIAGSQLALWRVREQQEMDLSAVLRSMVQTAHRAIITWSDHERAATESWASNPEVIALTQSLLGNSQLRAAGPTRDGIRNMLRQASQAHGFESYLIVTQEGTILDSSTAGEDGNSGMLIEQKEFLDWISEGNTGMTLPLPSSTRLPNEEGRMEEGRAVIFVAAPIHGEGEQPIAILVFQINPFRTSTAILQRARIGGTGETYAFDDAGRLISQSRFDSQLIQVGLIGEGERAMLGIELRDPGVNLVAGESSVGPRNELPLTKMVREAIGQDAVAHDVEGYRDYRGVHVVGAWLWDTDNHFGLTTELDHEEAYASYFRSRFIIGMITTIASLLIIGIGCLFAGAQRRVSRDSRKLEEALTKALSGYICICCSCKKVRDDAGVWHPVESYVSHRTEAKFSHGICEDCGQKLYPDTFTPEGST